MIKDKLACGRTRMPVFYDCQWNVGSFLKLLITLHHAENPCIPSLI